MKIAYLCDRPEFIETIASWLFAEWGHKKPNNSVELIALRLRTHLHRDRLPLTVIALDGDSLLGTASLRESDLEERPELSPWLASVYVTPEHRTKGIGSILVTAIESNARSIGREKIYLYTPDKQEFYGRLDWIPMERLEHRGKQVTIMHKALHGIKPNQLDAPDNRE